MVACDLTELGDARQRGPLLAAAVADAWTALREGTADLRLAGVRRLTLEARHAIATRLMQARGALSQERGVRVARGAQELAHGRAFDHPAGVHYDDGLRNAGHDPEVMADEHDGCAELRAHIAQQGQ